MLNYDTRIIEMKIASINCYYLQEQVVQVHRPLQLKSFDDQREKDNSYENMIGFKWTKLLFVLVI